MGMKTGSKEKKQWYATYFSGGRKPRPPKQGKGGGDNASSAAD